MSRAEDLQSDYDRLGTLLADEEDGAKAAALARERRLLGELVEALAKPEELSVADQLGERRRAKSETAAPAAGRRRSRGG